MSGIADITPEVVIAYRDAPQEQTRERAPPYWAQTQVNLANANGHLWKKEQDIAITRLRTH